MIVISDTSPITNLSAIGQLDLLHQLFGQVIVGPTVLRELKREGGNPGSEIETLDWVEIKNATNLELVHELEGKIHAGEAETIAIAIELAADWVLMDEKAGRAVAMERGLQVIGLLGIISRAKVTGLIPEARPLIQQLVDHGFHLHPAIVAKALQELGE